MRCASIKKRHRKRGQRRARWVKRFLLLRLEGPLQSWGVRSRWDVRDSASEPTKSGVIGLLGCVLGYPMRVEHPGAVFNDYQTITDYLPTAGGNFRVKGGTLGGPAARLAEQGYQPATILSPRIYLEDAAFLVALEARGADSLQVLAASARAVQRPQWPLFLGRKACVPTRPIFEDYGERYEDIEDALRHHRWEWLGARCELRTEVPKDALAVFIERDHGELSLQDATRHNAARTYGFRRAHADFFPAVAVNDASAPEVP